MNTPSPLVPQGAIPTPRKPTIFVKVMIILAVHAVLIGGMLMQGCKDTKSEAIQPTADTSSAAAPTSDTVPPVANTSSMSNAVTSNVPQPVTQTPTPTPTPMPAGQPTTATPPVAQPQPQPMPEPTPTAPPASTEGREYTIAPHDTLGSLARKNGVSLKAILAANPGVDPRKLKVGQKIQIPGGATSSASEAATSGDTILYTVKSRDTLGKIAKLNHTTYKKIMALNNLSTTSIRIGQKLKLPAGAETAPSQPAPSAAVVPTPLQTAPPTATTASTSPAPGTTSN